MNGWTDGRTDGWMDGWMDRYSYFPCNCYSKGGRGIGLTTLPPSCEDCLQILGASTSWSPEGLSRPVIGHLNILARTVPEAIYRLTLGRNGVRTSPLGTVLEHHH